MVGVRRGDPRPAPADAEATRRAVRPLHGAVEPGCAATAEGCSLAARSRVRLASIRQGPARASPPRPDARAHSRRDAGVGERGARSEFRPAAAARLPPLRDRRRPSLSVGSALADLERAEQAPLAQADEGVDLRPAPAQPRVRGNPCGASARARRRRRDRAEGRGGRRLTRHLGACDVGRRREARRLRAPPVSVDPRQRRRRAAAARTARGSRWRRSRSSSSS